MSALLNFSIGNFKPSLSELEKSDQYHNIEISKYYQSGCKDVNELLLKLQTLEQSSLCSYNIAVLLFYKENYGAALTYLISLYNTIECLSDYIAIKTCILITETYIAMDMKSEARQCIERLETSENFIGILKTAPKSRYFAGLLVGSWIEDTPIEDICSFEYWFIINIFKCRYHLLQGESEPAKKSLGVADSYWVKIAPCYYDEDLFKSLQTQQICIMNYLSAEIAYTEGNMNATLQQLNQAQIEILPLLGEKQSHPSCIPSRERLSHPIYHYNNLGCIHLRLGKPRLSRFYFTKALETLKPHTPVDVSKPLCTVTYHSSQRRADLLYNSALSLLNSYKPKQAFECLQEISPLMQNKPLYWYRVAECYVMMSLKSLASGRREMMSDICLYQSGKKYNLPAKFVYTFKEEEDKEVDNPLEQAAMCLRNALTFCKDEELRINLLLLLCYVCMNTQPQCALSSAQQLLHMEVTDSQRFIATMYASEALLILGKPRQAIEYLSHIPKEIKLKCHSTLSSAGAVFTEEVSSKFVQSINLSSAHLHAGNIPLAQQALNSALSFYNLTFQPTSQPSQHVPAPILNLAIYISLRLGNHAQAESFLRSRHIYAGMPYTKPPESTLNK
jgi:tetratricopeptide (TPR) repeat protein